MTDLPYGTTQPTDHMLTTADDVTDAILEVAEEVSDSWFGDDERIDWELFLDRLADPYGLAGAGAFDFDEFDNAAIRKIQRHIRAYRSQG